MDIVKEINSINFHDGNVYGIKENTKDEYSIYLRTENLIKYEIILKGKTKILINDYREANIILDIELFNNNNFITEYNNDSALYNVLFGFDASLKNSDKYLNSVLSKICNGEFIVLRINPSYGCSIIAICETIKLMRL